MIIVATLHVHITQFAVKHRYFNTCYTHSNIQHTHTQKQNNLKPPIQILQETYSHNLQIPFTIVFNKNKHDPTGEKKEEIFISLDDVYLILMKGQSHVQLPPMIVLLQGLYTELSDISEGKVVNMTMHSLR